MPKMKTHSGAKKRFKVTGGGKGKKVVSRHANTSHILGKKSAKRKRRLSDDVVLAKPQAKNAKRQLLK